MTASSSQDFHAVDEDTIELEACSIDAEASRISASNDRTHSPDVQGQAGSHDHRSLSSDTISHITIPPAEDHLPRRTDAPQNDTRLMSDHEANSSVSVDTTEDEPINGSQRPALDETLQNLCPTWTEFYFRPLFLINLGTLFMLMIVVLEVLNSISQRNQGLVTASENLHYLWTYGPTFVLTMIATLWAQLEIRARQMMPWYLMSRGETPSQDGLMLNYVTSSTLGSLIWSLKRKHFLVSIGIGGSLILRLMIIFASGLLRLEYRSLTVGRLIIVEDVFDLSQEYHKAEGPLTTMGQYWDLLKYDRPLPHGTTSQLAVQTFVADDSEDSEDDQLAGEIQVFESSLEECDPFKFTFNYSDPNLNNLSVAIPASLLRRLQPWCYAKNGLWVADGEISQFLWNEPPTMLYKCTDSTAIEDQDHRILFISTFGPGPNETEVSGFMCEPRYSLSSRAVTNSTRYVGLADSLSIDGTIAETLEIGTKPFNMTEKILNTLGRAWLERDANFNTEWDIMLNASQPRDNPAWSFRNTSVFIEASQRMWKGLAAYIIKQDYTIPTRHFINGTSTSTQGRLCVQELSFRLIEAQMMVMIAFIAVLYFLRPGLFHRNPASLGAHAMILARSPDLTCRLRGYGVESKKVLRERLSKYVSSFPQRAQPEISAISLHHLRRGSEDMAEKPRVNHNDHRGWWSPVSVRWWFRSCLITAILAVMIALEVVLHVSNRGNGLGDVKLDGYLKYTWSILPTLALALVGLLLSIVDSTARILHPFQMLRKGRATMQDMLQDPARQVSLVAVLYAVWRRNLLLLWTTLPGLLAPILTIVSGGLYTVAPVPWTYDAELELKDWFRPENRIISPVESDWAVSDSHDASRVFILTQFTDMPYPQWTQGEYALASFGADNLHSHDGNDTSLYITARVPAARANLNCTLAGQYDDDGFQVDVMGSIWLSVDPLPLGCHPSRRSDGAVGSNLSLISYFSTRVDDTGDDSRACYLSLLRDTDPWLEKTSSCQICGDGRQHYFIGFECESKALSFLHCVPYVEALWVTAMFALPDLSVVADVPVEPDRGSAVFLSDSASMTAFGQTQSEWDEITVAVVNGSSGAGLSGRLPSSDDSNGIRHLIDAVESTLAKYMAQNLHFNYRQPLAGRGNTSAASAGQIPLNLDGHAATGTVTDRTRLRLVQNAASTRILQSLLGVMGACLVAATALGRGARVIPRDPGSIASRMAYFAGGDVWRHVPEGADRWTDEQISRYELGTADGRLLLGWWGGDDREDAEGDGRGKRFAVDSIGRKAVV